MSNIKNNIFYYATKELSQDAFICWLCSFALEDADKTDIELVNCAQTLIAEFMSRGLGKDINKDEISLKEINQQKHKIDVLLTVFFEEKEYKIIVEDKTHSSEHDNQLTKYMEKIKDEGFPVIGIYFKTGFQSNYSTVEKAGYKVFNRKDILAILDNCKSNNNTLSSYREYWLNFEKLAQSYKNSNLYEWPDWQTVNGFYEEMQGILEDNNCWADYGYVNNPSGGFWGLWYGPNDSYIVQENDFKISLYLQVETKWHDDNSRYEYRICTKMEDQSTQKDDERVLSVRDKVIEKQKRYEFERPTKLRWGTVMTTGEYKTVKENPSYVEFKESIIGALKQYQLLLTEFKKEN